MAHFIPCGKNYDATQTVYLWSAESAQSTQITDGLAEMGEPVFDPSGKHLFMLGSTDAGPVKDWFAQSNIDVQINHQIYVMTLGSDGPNPIEPLSDEVPVDGEDEDNTDGEGSDEEEGSEDSPVEVDIDFNGLKTYIVAREEERKRIMEQYKSTGGDADAGDAPEGAETAAAN